MRRIHVDIIGFENGRGGQSKECGQPPNAFSKGKKADSPQEPPERNTALLTPYFSLVRPVELLDNKCVLC